INVADDELRATQLRVCRHLKVGGKLIFERYDPDWLPTVEVGRLCTIGDFELFADQIVRQGARVHMCLRYEGPSGRWLHESTDLVLDDEAVAMCLSNAGFSRASWINRSWA